LGGGIVAGMVSGGMADQPKISPRTERLLIGAILLIAAALRIPTLGRESLWMDEGLTAWLVNLPWREMIAEIRNWEQTPPGLHAILWVWVQIFGDSDISLRMPSALLGVWAVWWIRRLGRESFGLVAGLVAAALLALNAYHIHYSQEARGYSLLVTAGLASWVFFLRCLRGEGGVRSQVGYVIATTVMLYAHLYGGFVALAEFLVYGVVWVHSRVTRAERIGFPIWPSPRPSLGVPGEGEKAGRSVMEMGLRRWLLLVASVAILCGPWVNVVLFEWTWVVTSGMFWLTERGPHMITRALAEYWGSPASATQGTVMSPVWILAATVAGILALLGLWRARRTIGAWLALLIVALSLVLPVLISMLWTPVFWPRYGMMAMMAIILLIGMATGVRQWTAWLAVVAAAALLALNLHIHTPKEDWRGVARDLQRDVRPGDMIMNSIDYSKIVFGHYWRRTDIPRAGASDAAMSRDFGDALRVWIPMHWTKYTVTDLEKENPGWHVAERREYEGIILVRLERSS
jgi:mannosyltransferase